MGAKTQAAHSSHGRWLVLSRALAQTGFTRVPAPAPPPRYYMISKSNFVSPQLHIHDKDVLDASKNQKKTKSLAIITH